VICGLPVVEDLFRRQAPEVMLSGKAKDGDRLPAAQRFLEVSGPARSILRLERIALNFVGRLSGIATGTARWVEKISGTRAKLFDTRKTTPGWRALEKYAVRVGGGHNHRRSLAEALLVKDNHVAVLRALGLWDVEACVRALRQAAPGLFLELEVASRDEFLAALRAGADAILLDNFDVPEVSWAVETRNRQPTAPGAPPGPLLEASGGIRLETVRAVAETGVERLSVGALTHSATSLDVALDFLGAYREGAG
jgi:nicotinate-nucleotide pyrophosphorylase (carboxylating)